MKELPPITIDPKTFLYEHHALPSLPKYLTKLQKIIKDEKMSADQVAKLVSVDPALVAQMIRIVNSAYYSLSFEITDIKLAVAYLGINEVYRIILALSVINTLASDSGKEFHEIWHHSVFTALISLYLAKKFDPIIDLNELWSCAILHDIGVMVYLKLFPDHFKELWKYSLDHGCLFCEAEKEYSMPSSAYFGELLCDRWGLPSQIKNVCKTHELEDLEKMDPINSHRSFELIVTNANLLAAMAMEYLNEKVNIRIKKNVTRVLNIDESKFFLMIGDIRDMKEEATMLSSP